MNETHSTPTPEPGNTGSVEHKTAMREWLMLQAELQQAYAQPEKAISLLELIESVYGESVTTSLMLCKAWTSTGQVEQLESKVSALLAHAPLSCERRAAIYYCLSLARWKANDRVGARKAHHLYLSLISESEAQNEAFFD